MTIFLILLLQVFFTKLVVYLQCIIISHDSKLVIPQKKAKNFGKRNSEENIDAETYIMGSSEQPSRKKSKKQKS
jgi:hypothetical protein